ncbi:glutathione S-transfersae-related protein [gamma proteobacterium IMCC2047]|nr:glutathione S-transfersae-related protein [gamma proteobacterium IMCC2047]
MPTVTTFYASLVTLLLVWLSINIIKSRQRFKITLGDGNNPRLKLAISAHANAAQYIPIALLLMLLLELNQAHSLLLHLFGLCLLAGRLIHARGILAEHIPTRVRGMQLTFFVLIGAAAANLILLIF